MKLSKSLGLALAAALVTFPAVGSAGPGSIQFGAPKKQAIYGELGYSGIPRIGYITPLGPRFAIGGEFILDIGQFYSLGTGVPGTVTIAGGAPIKVVLSETQELIVGLDLLPGIGVNIIDRGFFGSTTRFALLLHSGINVGYKVNQQVIVGGGAEIPLTMLLGDFSNAVIPIIFGPEVEFMLTPEFTLTGDLKMGPHITAGDFSRTDFGFKFQVGVAYSF